MLAVMDEVELNVKDPLLWLPQVMELALQLMLIRDLC